MSRYVWVPLFSIDNCSLFDYRKMVRTTLPHLRDSLDFKEIQIVTSSSRYSYSVNGDYFPSISCSNDVCLYCMANVLFLLWRMVFLLPSGCCGHSVLKYVCNEKACSLGLNTHCSILRFSTYVPIVLLYSCLLHNQD